MKNQLLKRCVAVLLGVSFMTSLAGCSNADSDKNVDITEASIAEAEDAIKEDDIDAVSESIDLGDATLINDGILTVGMVVDYPPFEYYPINGTEPIGVDVDIVNALADELGLEVEIKDVPWDDALFANIGSEYDVVCSAVTITDDRLEEMLFTDAYIDNYQSIVICRDSEVNIQGFESLDGLRIAVQKGTVSDEMMMGFVEQETISIELIENEIATDCFEQLKNGDVDAVVCDSTVAEGQVTRNSDVFSEVYRDESTVERFAIAIGKDNTGLQIALNKALSKLQNEGAVTSIIDSWFSR